MVRQTRIHSWQPGLPGAIAVRQRNRGQQPHHCDDASRSPINRQAPFNFFLFPIISEVGGYPPGVEKSAFNFIVPFESDRSKWSTLRGINLKDEKIYRIAMLPDGKRDSVVPESFRIILKQYLQHPEAKSLAPDGSACLGSTQGLLHRETIVAHKIISIGKETDRSWEQGEDPSILDFKLKEYGNESKMVIADSPDRKRWRKLGHSLFKTQV